MWLCYTTGPRWTRYLQGPISQSAMDVVMRPTSKSSWNEPLYTGMSRSVHVYQRGHVQRR